jgi:hypothetical protein
MALVVADRVWETTSTSGTGTLTLSGAVSGYQTFAVIGNGNTTYYTITNGTDWEVGIGTYTSSGTTLSRDTVLSSSLGGTKITVTPGSFVFVDYPASRAVYEDESGNVTGYPISGGTINNTSIGATTPSTVNATTITGQTARVNGTGQNFLTFSQTFQNAAWVKQTNVTATDNAVTAPDGTTTAASIAWGSASNATGIYQFKTGLSLTGISNTKSIYVRADVAGGTVVLIDASFGSSTTTLTLSTSWQRVTLTESAQTTAIGLWIQKTASSPATIYLWGAQAEIGSTANTYIPTTTTAVYGTPTLSFSGVAGLGLQSDGALYVSPAGTGALQAQATTSTTAGGNARGANAVDWQTARDTAARVASGSLTSIGGGYGNTANGVQAAISGGTFNTVSGTYNFVGAGYGNTATLTASSVVGGFSNTAGGFYNFVGGGYTNSGTAAATVTTQSATMNGTTTVTLSGSNASIKVGQLIGGTYINANLTYVAAISGTTLTLSTAATGSGTATLSFYTPHGVVVGGGNNQATGSYSFIGGGGDAGTAANRNVASGDWSTVGGGIKNTATGLYSIIGGGNTNITSGAYSIAAGGQNNNASNSYSTISGGVDNVSNSAVSTVAGGFKGTTRGITGYTVFPSCYIPISNTLGVSQAALLILGKQTTDATATVLTSDTGGAGGTNQVILPNNSAYFFKGSVIANVTGAANGAAWSFEGAIMRGANAASTVLIDTPSVNRVAASSGATAWTIALTADTTNGGLTVTVTGVASTTIRWVAKVETTEVTF